jgi:Ca2+-binding EF-hand superfamily protein
MTLHFTRFPLLALVVTCCLLSATALAEKGEKGEKGQRKKPDAAKIFQKRDANGDGSLSLDEFKTGMPEKAVARADVRFKKLDTSGDGKLSLEEFKAGMQPRPKKPE